MAVKHAKLSPSNAHRWMHCPGSWVLEQAIKDEHDTAYSSEGSKLHALVETCLTKNTDCPTTEAQDTQDDINFCLDFARRLSQGMSTLIEMSVPISTWTKEPEALGKADFIAYNDDSLYVVDWKFGAGVKVNAEYNPQITLYALGVYESLSSFISPKEIHLMVVQPRLDHVSEWVISDKQLKAQGRLIKAKATVCRLQAKLSMKELSLCPSKSACQFCKAKASCPAMQELATDTFDTSATEITGDELGYWMDRSPVLSQFIHAVEDEAMRRLVAGRLVAGYKLVKGTPSRRAWANPEEALSVLTPILGDKAMKTEVISPAQVEKFTKARRGETALLPQAQWQDIQGQLLKVPEIKPVVARSDDPREDWEPEAANADDFAGVEVQKESA